MQKVKKGKPVVFWGSPEYLVKEYNDIDSASNCSHRNKTVMEIRRLVKSVSTPKDDLSAYEVFYVERKRGEQKERCAIAHITFGLNGSGKQSDYLAALKRLVDTGKFFIFECRIDALDDVCSVLARFKG